LRHDIIAVESREFFFSKSSGQEQFSNIIGGSGQAKEEGGAPVITPSNQPNSPRP
jgi:hypothetical protein